MEAQCKTPDEMAKIIIQVKLTRAFEYEYAERCITEANSAEWAPALTTKTHRYVSMPVSRALDVISMAQDYANGCGGEGYEYSAGVAAMHRSAIKAVRNALAEKNLAITMRNVGLWRTVLSVKEIN